MIFKSRLLSAVCALLLFSGLAPVSAFGALITLSDYMKAAEPGRSWSYIYTYDTAADVDEYGGHLAGDEITVFDHPTDMYILSILSPTLETGTPILFEPDIYVYLDIIPELIVPAGTFNNVLQMAWLDSNFPTPNSMNTTLGLTSINMGVTDVNWFAFGVGEIKFLGVDASDGSIDGGFELINYSVSNVPVPAAVWLFSSGLIGLIGIARRKSLS